MAFEPVAEQVYGGVYLSHHESKETHIRPQSGTGKPVFIDKEYNFLTLRKIVRLYEPGNYQTSNSLLPKKQRITDSPENET
ncbi:MULTISPECIES: hypothetical protein [unclassified Escherichia]|uniref:hypothetical protein n=1 Tax=unclassified Escherichia TaxID=2608889 RepID=UPI001028BA0C|nr:MULTISPECIES: hypothetical protein [unclassified Escherichia]TGB63961.1 hypothetical protein CQB02_16400 [Escherichia coli]RZN21333.1 hypothetical protein D9734_07070 [Escherichia sp. E14S1]TBR70668.1 hypothetical protein D9737_02035 [Escherichia sp. E10V4]TGB76858.1 hypothetical protein CRI66_13160 [Escherichia sp. E4694]TGB91332.1 hypothetical protein CRG94_17820 [Escherichia sp. E3356]